MSGLGYILLENDFPMFYAPERYLGNWLTSYGLDFTVSIGLTSNGALNNNTALRYLLPLTLFHYGMHQLYSVPSLEFLDLFPPRVWSVYLTSPVLQTGLLLTALSHTQ